MTRPLKKALLAYLLLTGLLLHLATVSLYLLVPDHLQGRSLGWLMERVESRWGTGHPNLVATAATAVAWLESLGIGTPDSTDLPDFPDPDAWPGQGVSARGFQRQSYDGQGRPEPGQPGGFLAPLSGRERAVGNPAQLLQALREARPGDVITLLPGTYRLEGRSIALGGPGRPEAPIFVRAGRPGEVRLELDTLEGFFVNQGYWVFENLDIRGICPRHSDCEHAFHVVAGGRGTVLRNNRLTDFNAALKVNGAPGPEGQVLFPDHGLVEFNTVYNTEPRQTTNPVTPLNIDAGNGWTVRGNFIADFAKAGGDRVSYGGYMKGNSRDGLFEGNLVVCSWRQPLLEEELRVGLSLGGGGTARQFCREQDCSREHTGGVIRNNVILRCPAEVGLYLNRAADSRVYNNLLAGTRGIDVRYDTSSAEIFNNIFDGGIYLRDGATSQEDHNLIPGLCLWGWLGHSCGLRSWLADPLAGDLRLVDPTPVFAAGRPVAELERDFCGNRRDETPDLGPLEYRAGVDCLPQP